MAIVGREWVARCLGEATMHEWPDGGEVRCSPLQRRIVAALAVEPGRVWEPDALVDAVWGEKPPSTARASLHNLISRLRQSLPAHVLVSVGTVAVALAPPQLPTRQRPTQYVVTLVRVGGGIASQQRITPSRLASLASASFTRVSPGRYQVVVLARNSRGRIIGRWASPQVRVNRRV